PTTSNDHNTGTLSASAFTAEVNNSSRSTSYYLRAYATNSNGTNYGDQLQFTTEDIPYLEGDEYSITKLSDLEWLSETSARWGDDFGQSADIDAAGTSSWNSNAGFIPIGNSTNKFTGNYDGGNYSISNLTISRSSTDYIGLFGYLENSGVSKLRLASVSITGQNNVGAVAGLADGSSISQCAVTGSISGADNMGGVVGSTQNSNSIEDSYTTADITRVSGASGTSIGGFMGHAEDTQSSVRRSYCSASVYYTGTTAPTDKGFGGGGTFTLSSYSDNFWDSEASNQSSADGATAKTTAEMKYVGTYTDERSDGLANTWSFTDHPFDDDAGQEEDEGIWNIDQSGSSNSGYPFLSAQDAAFSYTGISASTGILTSITSSGAAGRGFIRNGSGETISSAGLCWNTSSTPTIAHSKTTNGSEGNFSSNLSGLTENTTYYIRAYVTTNITSYYGNEVSIRTPHITSEPSISNGKYQIGTLSELAWISEDMDRWGYDYEQTANIDASGTSTWNDSAGFRPIGEINGIQFTGSYDGHGFTIDELTINRPGSNYVGLFGYTSSATLSNIRITDAFISADYRTGVLIGYSSGGTVTNCSSSGSVSGDNSIGGLIGYNLSTTSACFSTANVTGTRNVGGLCGNTGNTTITNCYSRGSVTRKSGSIETSIGAFIGIVYEPTIQSCYATGSVTYEGATNPTDKGFFGEVDEAVENGPSCSNNFFDQQTTGQSSDAYTGEYNSATAKGTSAMKNLETFTYEYDGQGEGTEGLDTAWDFVSNPNDDSANNDDWDMSSSINDGYPYLSWEDGEDQSLAVELSFFKATVNNGSVLLLWQTESEIENLGFILENRIRGESEWLIVDDFNTHTDLTGHGSTNETHLYEYTDNKVNFGCRYEYRLSDVDYVGNIKKHPLIEVFIPEALSSLLPGQFNLLNLYPNPFNPELKIKYETGESTEMRITVFDIQGRELIRLVNQNHENGFHEINWQADHFASGVYLVRFESGRSLLMRKVTLLK
ncbi:MAG: GLUG motif-containing protein, partial [Candidatus Marinimicrobia bacterium]|nr:GLUG motif-containing protein [Candidatus Neomarinimicrobiota bacterium]